MAMTRREEARALDKDERELVEKSHHPEVQDLSDADLAHLVKLVRTRRDKAQTEANRRRREIRGKAGAKGAEPSKADSGSRLKLEALAMAMRRLNAEATRRERMAARVSQAEIARRALSMKQQTEDAGPAFSSRTAHAGMREVASKSQQKLVRPMELGRQRQAAKVAQARRDAR